MVQIRRRVTETEEPDAEHGDSFQAQMFMFDIILLRKDS